MGHRTLQHRDVNTPIEEAVREHLGQLGVAAIHYGPLTRALQDIVHDLIVRAQTEAVAGASKDPDPVPVFGIRADSVLALGMLNTYRDHCEHYGYAEADVEASRAFDVFAEWQQRNPAATPSGVPARPTDALLPGADETRVGGTS